MSSYQLMDCLLEFLACLATLAVLQSLRRSASSRVYCTRWLYLQHADRSAIEVPWYHLARARPGSKVPAAASYPICRCQRLPRIVTTFDEAAKAVGGSSCSGQGYCFNAAENEGRVQLSFPAITVLPGEPVPVVLHGSSQTHLDLP